MPGLSLVFLVLLIPAARAVEFTSDATITSSLYTGHDTIVNHCTLTIDWGGGRGDCASLHIVHSGHVTHPAGSEGGLWLSVSGNATIHNGSSIAVSGMGYGGDATVAAGYGDGVLTIN